MKESKGHRATDMLQKWNNDSIVILKLEMRGKA